MTQKKKDILYLVLPIICAVIALVSLIGAYIVVSQVRDIKEIIDTRLPEPAEQTAPVATEQTLPTPTYAPSPEPTAENSVQTKPAPMPTAKPETPKIAEQPKPEVKQETTVYVSKYGECYHNDRNCYHIRKSEVTALSLSEAKKLYRPCSHCAG